MATSFDRWEKDPFFSAAEEVQESADRMESVYRQWIHERRDGTKPTGELRRDLHTALGTAKWQLEELERAVALNDEAWSAGKDTRTRHAQFAAAIADRILMVENSLKESSLEDGEGVLSWVRLDEGERDELAMFLSCSVPEEDKVIMVQSAGDLEVEGPVLQMNGKASASCSKNSSGSNESRSQETREERACGHRRMATPSTFADDGELKILVSSDEACGSSLDKRPNLPPPRMLSFSGLTSAVESATKAGWYRNGFRKWKGGYRHDLLESIPLQNHQLSRDIDACYERSKSCLSNCDDSYDKQIDGWAGALYRQLQRSQYQIQYGRPIQIIMWVIIAVLFIVLFVLHAN